MNLFNYFFKLILKMKLLYNLDCVHDSLNKMILSIHF